jgi:protein SMG8
VYQLNARGPAAHSYAVKLTDECTKIWRQGRQLCGVESLTGNQCLYKVRDTDDKHHGDVTHRDEEGSRGDHKEHSSGVKYLHACSCGRLRSVRADPFLLQVLLTSFMSPTNSS